MYLGLHVSVVVTLQKQRSGLGVIFAGSDVQRRKADLPLGVILQQEGNHLVVALLQRHRQGGEPVLRSGRNSLDTHTHIPKVLSRTSLFSST